MLVVRRPVRAVGPATERDRLPVRLAIGVIVALGVLAALWLMGALGTRHGFASLVRVPDLVTDPVGALTAGIVMLINVPQLILTVGDTRLELMMLAFLLVAIPAGGLAAVRPHQPGGPKPSTVNVTFSYAGAIAAGVISLALVWWTASPQRGALLRELPGGAGEAEAWLRDLQTAAGLDTLSLIAATVWMVLTMRLVIPNWLRGLTATAAFFALATTFVAMSASTVGVTQMTEPRSLCHLDQNAEARRLLIGATPSHLVTLKRDAAGGVAVELYDFPSQFTVERRQSIAEFSRGAGRGRTRRGKLTGRGITTARHYAGAVSTEPPHGRAEEHGLRSPGRLRPADRRHPRPATRSRGDARGRRRALRRWRPEARVAGSHAGARASGRRAGHPRVCRRQPGSAGEPAGSGRRGPHLR